MAELTFVGAVTRDLMRRPLRWITGGAVIYGGAAADALAARVRVVTAHSARFERPEWSRAWEWLSQPSAATTAFENRELRQRREQRLWARCVSSIVPRST